MKVAFDTSALVPALVTRHPFHARAQIWLRAAATGQVTGLASWHAIAECWSVLTRLPLAPALTPERARLVVERLTRHLDLIPPAPELYQAAIERCATCGLRSGAIFDVLHLVTAERAEADALVTFNARDFERASGGAGPRLVVPPDPPRVEVP